MELVKIKLLSNVMLNSKTASPGDSNKGVYSVKKSLANNLIARKRAVLFSEKDLAEGNPAGKPPKNVVNYDLEALKNIANKLELKYNPNIGGEKLNKKILEHLAAKNEKLGLFDDAIKAFEVYTNTQTPEAPAKTPEHIELISIAKEAEIDFDENLGYDELKSLVNENLKQYASEVGIELGENWDTKEAWESIKEKLADD